MSKSIVTPQDLRDFAVMLQNNIDEFSSIKSRMDEKLNSYDWQDAVAVKFKSEYELTKGPMDKLNAAMEKFIKYLNSKANGLDSGYIGSEGSGTNYSTMAFAATGSVAAVGGAATSAKVFTAKAVPSVEDYKEAFKRHGVYVIDNNGEIKTDRNKVFEAINEVHGNKPKIKYDNLDKGHHGYQKGNTITMNEKESDNGNILFNTYAHESQHMDQDEFCKVEKNSKDALCENIKDYKQPCDTDTWKKNTQECDIKYKEYKEQIMEVNAREAGANAEKAAVEYLHDFKIEHKLEKPRAHKKI